MKGLNFYLKFFFLIYLVFKPRLEKITNSNLFLILTKAVYFVMQSRESESYIFDYLIQHFEVPFLDAIGREFPNAPAQVSK